MYTLYYSPGTASFAVHWMLIHIGAAFELVEVNLEAKEQRSAQYLALNPSGHVPTLLIAGKPRTECAALLMMLAERHPEARLAPVIGDPDRDIFLQSMFYLANTVQPAFRMWFYADEMAGVENVAATKFRAQAKIETALLRLDTLFTDGRRFLAGEDLTAVDFLATMLMRWSRNMTCSAMRYDHLADYLRRMWTIPSLRQVHDDEGLTDWVPG
ncbi:MAG TPA: glutathione S-transferase family protein [Steroidobacteraceae bacterium]